MHPIYIIHSSQSVVSTARGKELYGLLPSCTNVGHGVPLYMESLRLLALNFIKYFVEGFMTEQGVPKNALCQIN